MESHTINEHIWQISQQISTQRAMRGHRVEFFKMKQVKLSNSIKQYNLIQINNIKLAEAMRRAQRPNINESRETIVNRIAMP